MRTRHPRLPPAYRSRATSDFSWYRFYRKDLKGKRVEATAMGGPLFSGPQQEVGRYRGFPTGVGWIGGAVAGVASRSYYVWGGGTYQWYPNVSGNQRPNLLTFTGVAGYRPFSWRTDYPRWDWRIFGELTAERSRRVSLAECAACGEPRPPGLRGAECSRRLPVHRYRSRCAVSALSGCDVVLPTGNLSCGDQSGVLLLERC